MASFAQSDTLSASGKVLRSAGVHVRLMFRIRSVYSMRMTAICSRVTGRSGSNVVPSPVPATTPV